MTIPALFVLKDDRAAQFERRSVTHKFFRNRMRRSKPTFPATMATFLPYRSTTAITSMTKMTDKTATGRRTALFSPVGEMNGSASSSGDADGGRDEKNEHFHPIGQQRHRREDRQEIEIGPRVGVYQGGVGRSARAFGPENRRARPECPQ